VGSSAAEKRKRKKRKNESVAYKKNKDLQPRTFKAEKDHGKEEVFPNRGRAAARKPTRILVLSRTSRSFITSLHDLNWGRFPGLGCNKGKGGGVVRRWSRFGKGSGGDEERLWERGV